MTDADQAVVQAPLPVREADAPAANHARGVPSAGEVRPEDELVGEPDTSSSAAGAELTQPHPRPVLRSRKKR